MTNPIVFVHGYNHDPQDPLHSPSRSPDGFFNVCSQIFKGGWHVPLPWYSGRQFKDSFRAWKAGRLTTYSWAYNDLADDAAQKLLDMQTTLMPDVICHSLGSRVVLRALEVRPNAFRRVIFLNGAETVKVAAPIIENSPWTRFLNVHVSTDDVLGKMGAWFEPEFGKHHCIGYRGIGGNSEVGNLTEIQLDSKAVQDMYRHRYGWDLRGDNPNSIGDHSFSYLHEGNWPLYRKFIAEGQL